MDYTNIEAWLGQGETLEGLIIHPRNKKYQIWSFLIAITSLSNSILVSYQASFCDVSVVAVTFSYIFDTLFLLNMIVTFFVAFYARQGVLITKKTLIAKRYMLTLFVFDFITVFPTDIFASSDSVLLYRLNRALGIGRSIYYFGKTNLPV